MVSDDELIEVTRVRVLGALESVLRGVGPDEAVLGSGMLQLFDDGDDVDELGLLGELASASPQEWELVRVQAVVDVLGDMLATCARWEDHGDVEVLTAELVELYHRLASLVPRAVWRHRLESALSALVQRSEQSSELAVARARAVERLGSLHRLMEAVDRWEPDAGERRRLQGLLAEGRAVDAVVQALEQAVFSAELEEL